MLGTRDEAVLLERLRDAGEIRIFESFANTAEELEVSALPLPAAGHLFFQFWPTRFSWQPEFAQTRTPSQQWYVSNKATAPLLEYSRPSLSGSSAGRLYWSDRFSGEPAYDRIAFGKWVDSIWRWTRRVSIRRNLAGALVWVFPQAAGSASDAG